MSPSLVLWSGGIDAAVALAMELAVDAKPSLLEFDTPRRPQQEILAADALRSHYGLAPPIRISYPRIPQPPPLIAAGPMEGYLPMRNLWFHANAALVARHIGATRIVAGHRRDDADEFPDARPSWFTSLAQLMDSSSLPSEPKLTIHLPLADLNKQGVIDQARILDVPIALTWACTRDGNRPCGECTSCLELAETDFTT